MSEADRYWRVVAERDAARTALDEIVSAMLKLPLIEERTKKTIRRKMADEHPWWKEA